MNEKMLMEKRNELLDNMDNMLKQGEQEQRALTTEENEQFSAWKVEIGNIDETLKNMEEKRELEKKELINVEPAKEQRALDEEKFLKFIKGDFRALSVADNGGIIPETIAKRIIEAVKEKSPIYRLVDVYNVGGDLVFPVYGPKSVTEDMVTTTYDIVADYVDDLSELTAAEGAFTTVTLTNFIIGCLAKISKSLMNRTDFDLLGYVIDKVAQAIADFLEGELLHGTADKMTGVLSSSNVVEATAATFVAADELIDLQMAVKQQYQANACWIMAPATFSALRKLKDTNLHYLLNQDMTREFGWTLLGKPVYISENMPAVAAEATPIVYGDMTGLALKFAQNIEVQVLNEKYATQHAVGVVAYAECDSKIINPQKIAVLTMAAADPEPEVDDGQE